MMPLQTNKKILVYFFLFILLGTLHNKSLNKFNIPKIKEIKISGLDQKDNHELLKKFDYLKIENLFFLDKTKIENIINSNNLIEKYLIFKKYPSSLEIKVNKTEFLAYFNKDGKIFFLGSNGKFIDAKDEVKKIPFIFGNFRSSEFYNLKKIVDKSVFDFKEIKNLFFFPSGRWDIELDSGILIKLPKKKLKESLDLSIKILSSTKNKDLKVIDLRQKNQVIING